MYAVHLLQNGHGDQLVSDIAGFITEQPQSRLPKSHTHSINRVSRGAMDRMEFVRSKVRAASSDAADTNRSVAPILRRVTAPTSLLVTDMI